MMKLFVSPNKLIIQAVSTYFPTSHLKYSGGSSNYAIFRISNRDSIYTGSGKNIGVRSYGYIDIFTEYDPSSSSSVMKDVESSLVSHGINVLGISTTYSPDDNYFHTEFEIEVVQDV